VTSVHAGPGGLVAEVGALLREARAVAPDPSSAATLDDAVRRLEEPLRVAIAGKVKAGKSTLLNALVGEELAPTDAGECTRLITWYRNAHTYRVDLYAADGTARQVPFRRQDGALEIELGGTPLEAIDHLDVWWPSRRLEDVTLIDTPGIGSVSTDLSARTYDFLITDDERPTAADAVLYLLRHLHSTDVRFLEAFHDHDLASGTPVNAVGVLSRADEIGACRLKAMDAAWKVADRYVVDARIRQLCRLVVPVAGLLAQAGATLREEEFQQVASIATDPRHDPNDLLFSVDRFLADDLALNVPAEARRQLLDRLGLFGVRVAIDLVRTGRTTTSPAMAAELVRVSGIEHLRAVLRWQLTDRSRALKARSSLATLSTLLRSPRWPEAEKFRSRLEMVIASAHEITEIRILNSLWLGELELQNETQSAEMARLLGGEGTAAHARLAMPAATPVDELRKAAMDALQRWSRIAEHPLSSVGVKAAARAVTRSCEGLLAALDASAASPGPA
jgi:hypothetical protein